jgi:GNAT superfamily N-acetyltransferase
MIKGKQTRALPGGPSSLANVVMTRRERTVAIRPLTPPDGPLLVELLRRLTPETRRMRFLAQLPDRPDDCLWQEAQQLAARDPRSAATLIATMQASGTTQAVGVAQLVGLPGHPTTAGIGLVVRDDYQGEGLGTQLLAGLIQAARERGLASLWGVTLAENAAMQRLICCCGLPVTTATDAGLTIFRIVLGSGAHKRRDAAAAVPVEAFDQD